MYFDYNYVFLIVAKFEIRKRLYEFIELFHESNLPSLIPSFCINVVGEVTTMEHKNQFKKISDYIKNNNISYIKLHVNVPNSEIINYYKSSNIFILSSYNEVASYSNIEAMANGLLTIVGDLNGTSCYIDHNYDGYIYKTNDLNSLISTIEFIISLPIEKFHEIRLNSFKKFQNLYNKKLFIDKITLLLEK
jgi:glycosyltransferase involved in cell wall biosynthesis